MTETQTAAWKRPAIEATVIIVSILLAFAIDAWWEERVERNDESEQLRRLQTEFVTNIERIDVRDFEEGILEACVEVFELIEEGQKNGREEIDVSAKTIGRMLTAPTFDADTPILNGLVRSGRLEIIQNEKVLTLISEWERTLYDYTTFAERARRSVDERLIPAIVLRGDIGPILMTPMLRFSQVDASPLGEVTLRVDDELKGLVSERWRNGRSALDRFAAAREVAEKLVSAIESDQ